MKIFISHSSRDRDMCIKLCDILMEKGHIVFDASVNNFDVGKSIFEVIKTELSDADVFIAIITENFVNSSWAQAELSSVMFSTDSIHILPVVVGDVFVPDFLRGITFIKVNDPEEVTEAVLKGISQLSVDKESSTLLQKRDAVPSRKNDLEEKIAKELTTGSRLQNENIEYVQTDNETISVTLEMNFIENIAVEQPLDGNG